jgi:tetratricopeptide (TPR) repeat protein/mono/diheme cytochrome c family protein
MRTYLFLGIDALRMQHQNGPTRSFDNSRQARVRSSELPLMPRLQFTGRAILCLLALGALVARSAAAQPNSRTVTFSRDVAPLLFTHCAPCHRPGEAGGFSLLTFADARPRAAAIARATRTRAMPPWKPEPLDGVAFAGARRLAETDIATIQRWVEGGAQEGNPADLPATPVFPEGWRLGVPDMVVAMQQPIELEPGSRDQLRNVVIPVDISSTRYVRGLEFRPENTQAVHHANIRVDRTRTARTLDAFDRAPGFDGRLAAGAFPDGQFLGWTPGQLPPLLADGTAWRLDPGSDLVVQLHLRPASQAERIQIRIGLYFSDRPPTRTPVMVRLGRQNIDIAPGTGDYRVEDRYRLPVAVSLLAVQPHAHMRARGVTGSAVLPDGSVRSLLRIGDWDFDWQDQYRYVSPISLPAGTVLTMTFAYDNSVANRRNPDRPPRRVLWGQNTDDEMGDLWFQVAATTDADREALASDVGRKVLAEDAVGYETLLRTDPNNPRLHEAAASLLLSIGQVDRGIAHLRDALRVDPSSAEAHYNLATAFIWRDEIDAALEHLASVLAVAPNHVGAHVNTAALLRRRGDTAQALAHLDRALQIDPGNAAAHTNRGGLMMAAGQVSAAAREYRAALDTNPSLLEPLLELTWTLATSPDASLRNEVEAVRLGERARLLTGDRDVRTLDAVAAAFASAGRFAEAIDTLERAIALVAPDAAGSADTLRLLRARLAVYRRGEPFRDVSRADAR